MEERITELTVAPTEKNEGETQTDNRHYEQMVETNQRLKTDLETFEMRIASAIDERPDLFAGVSQETNARLNHLISTLPLIDHWKKYA